MCNNVLINLAQSIIKFYKLRGLGTSLQGQIYGGGTCFDFADNPSQQNLTLELFSTAKLPTDIGGEHAAVRAATPSLGTDGGAWGSRCNVLIDELMVVEPKVQGAMSSCLDWWTDGGFWGSRCNVLIDELMVDSEVQGAMSYQWTDGGAWGPRWQCFIGIDLSRMSILVIVTVTNSRIILDYNSFAGKISFWDHFFFSFVYLYPVVYLALGFLSMWVNLVLFNPHTLWLLFDLITFDQLHYNCHLVMCSNRRAQVYISQVKVYRLNLNFFQIR